MVNSPIIRRRDGLEEAYSPGFLITLKHWMGRLFSTCINLPHQLLGLISRTNQVSHQVFEPDSLPEKTPPLTKRSQTEFDLSPNSSGTVQSEDLDDLKNSSSIMRSMFENFGKKLTTNENIFVDATFFTLDGKKLDGNLKPPSQGSFQVEWNLNAEGSEKLIYRGALEQGTFHGKGSFITEDCEDGTRNVILDGHFVRGQFILGMAVMDNCYIDASFINGEKRGVGGTIHYFEKNLEYRGDFLDGFPHGQGKMFALHPTGVELIGEGEYQNGMPIKGFFRDKDGTIYKGQWEINEKRFKGSIKNYEDRFEYEGEKLNNLYHGKGKLTHFETYVYEKWINNEEDSEDELIDVEEEVMCITEGEFRGGKIFKGTQQILWNDDKKTGKIVFENSKGIQTEISDGSYKYEGKLDLSITGEGTILNADGVVVYEGNMKGGYPHGKGCRYNSSGEKSEEGDFYWGELQQVEGEGEPLIEDI